MNLSNEIWNDHDIAQAHRVSSISLFVAFGIVSLVLLVISFINGWKVLNKDKQLNAKQFVLSLFFIGSFISPIFGRFFRSSLDFKYFYALVESNATLVDQLVEIPKPLIMNIYAISVFGTAVTLPIMLIIYKFSTSLEAYHPTITKIRIMLAITLLHILVDIPALICEYFYVDKYITTPPPVFVPMKSILLVIENCFMLISICMVEFRSATLHNLDIVERVMIMRFALLGILLYLGGNIIRLALMMEQAYNDHSSNDPNNHPYLCPPNHNCHPNFDVTCATRLQTKNQYPSYIAEPFKTTCLNYAEIVMLTLVALSVLVSIIVLISNIVLHQRLNKYRTFIESQNSETRPKNEGETNHDPDAIRDENDNEE